MSQRHLLLLIYSELLTSGGGKETWLAELLGHRRLLESFASIHVACIRLGDHPNDVVIPRGLHAASVRFHVLDLRGVARTTARLLKWSAHCRAALASIDSPPEVVDIVAAGSFHEALGAVACRPGSGAGPRLVSWIHTTFTKEASHRHNLAALTGIRVLEKVLLARMDLLIANGDDTAHRYGVSTVIRNGVHVDAFVPAEGALAHRALRIGFVGRLSPEKGIEAFIRAVALLSDKADVDIVIAGDGILRPRVEAFMQGSSRVRYMGPLPRVEVPALLAELDVTVHLSHSGSLGATGVSYSLLESMAAGNVIVCWDTLTFRQVVSSSCAVLVPEGDAVALAEALLEIARDREPARQRRAAALERVKQFTFDDHVERFLDVMRVG